ncbi:hypothetical protein ACLOJK_012410 [Asimina triloba]
MPSLSPRLLCSFLLHLALLSSLCHHSTSTPATNVTDRLVLLTFKNRIIQDPLNALSSWNASLHFCLWRGISCSLGEERVTGLNLTSLKLVGSIPPHVGNLTFLTGFDLSNNGFSGEIPPELGRLPHLQHLNLSFNSLHGQFPSNLSYCLELDFVNFGFNELTGEIPVWLGSLPKLHRLHLFTNNFTGSIPPSLGNLSSLFGLSLRRNSLEGNIPAELARLKNLRYLQISENQLSGTIPPSIYNLSRLEMLSVTSNELHGSLPPDLFIALPVLQLFYAARNHFTGQIPVSLPNASFLEDFFISNNEFTGSVPPDVGRVKRLFIFSIGANRLGTGKQEDLNFLDSLSNCTKLRMIRSDANSFQGLLPNSIANLSTQLDWLAIGRNHLYGNLPAGIGNLIGLTHLSLEHNSFTGTIPADIGKLRNMKQLDLSGNKFSGQIPSSIGDMTQLIELYLQENRLWGRIPSSLGNCQLLVLVNLSQNSLNGTIPKEVVSLSSLSISLNLAGNWLTGPLPMEVGRLENLAELDISANRLSGEIPGTFGGCASLERLRMGGNSFRGRIPRSLETLRGVEELDLSRNNLSGEIPSFLEGFTALKKLNLSYNDLDGEVPSKGVFKNASAVSLSGNAKLCGGVPTLNLPSCTVPGSKRQRILHKVQLQMIIITACLILFLLIVFALCWRRKSVKKHTPESLKEQCPTISYAELLKSTDGFSSGNLIGAGSYGSVFKGHFDQDDQTVAVKVLNLQRQGALRSFLAECEALRNVRHRNLVKIITSCSSIDYKGNEFKALVFEYLPNGSLEEWLHPEEGDRERSLSLTQRLNIAIDVASALDYLHNHCQTPISHCDLKPSNVLLDNDMVAHVSDFGIARFLSEKEAGDQRTDKTNSIAIQGSIGYVAPEYGMGGNVSPLGDVYSYGILLLEMFTGKRPTEDMFRDGLSIREFVKALFPSRSLEIVDPQLLIREQQRQQEEQEEQIRGRRRVRRQNPRNEGEDTGNISKCLRSEITN